MAICLLMKAFLLKKNSSRNIIKKQPYPYLIKELHPICLDSMVYWITNGVQFFSQLFFLRDRIWPTVICTGKFTEIGSFA